MAGYFSAGLTILSAIHSAGFILGLVTLVLMRQLPKATMEAYFFFMSSRRGKKVTIH